MALEHVRWDKHGRTYRNTDTGEFVWTSGGENVWDEATQEYQPYIWDAATQTLRYGGDQEATFSGGEWTVKKAGQAIISSSRLVVQAWVGGEWVNCPKGTPIRNLAHNYPEEGRVTGYLDWPDATLPIPTAPNFDLQAGIEVGKGNGLTLGVRLRSPIAGRVRLVWLNDAIPKLATTEGWEWIEDREGVKRGILFGNGIRFTWTPEEAAHRTAQIAEVDGKKNLVVVMGPYDVEANEWLTIYPDTQDLDAAYGCDIDSAGTKGTYDDLWIGNPTGNQSRICHRFSLSGVSFDASDDITAVGLQFQTYAGGNGTLGTCDIYPYNSDGTGNPQTDSGSTTYTRARSGTSYATTDTITTYSATWFPTSSTFYDLGSAACGHLEAILDASGTTYSVALSPSNQSIASGNYRAITRLSPNLRVTYTTGGGGRTASVGGTLSVFTSSMAGKALVGSNVVASLSPITSGQADAVLVTADLVAAIEALVASLAASPIVESRSAEITALLTAITSEQIAKVLVQTIVSGSLPELSSSSVAKVLVNGIVNADLAALVASIEASTTGELPERTAAITAALTQISSLLTAAVLVQGNANAQLTPLTGDLLVGWWCGNTHHTPHELPDTTFHGYSGPEGDTTHHTYVRYRVPATEGGVLVTYSVFDVDYNDGSPNGPEVEIFCNGIFIGSVQDILNGLWQYDLTIYIPDEYVNSSSDNYISFENQYNRDRGNNYVWGIKNVSYTVIPVRIASVVSALEALVATINAAVLVNSNLQALLETFTAYIRARTTISTGVVGFPCIDGGTISILGG